MNVIYQERSLLENQYQQLGSQQGRQHTIVARSPASMALFGVAREIAQRDTTVMLTGEPGVGKEILARFIHQNSARRGKPFVPVNCSAIPSELMEAEFSAMKEVPSLGQPGRANPACLIWPTRAPSS